jgi:hypothetical protein
VRLSQERARKGEGGLRGLIILVPRTGPVTVSGALKDILAKK